MGNSEIQTDHLILARQPDLMLVNQKQRNCQIEYFAVLADHRVKLKEGEERGRKLKKTMEHESGNDSISIGTENGGCGNKITSGDYPNYRIIMIGQNSKKSPGDLRLTVTQTPVENHQLMLV